MIGSAKERCTAEPMQVCDPAARISGSAAGYKESWRRTNDPVRSGVLFFFVFVAAVVALNGFLEILDPFADPPPHFG